MIRGVSISNGKPIQLIDQEVFQKKAIWVDLYSPTKQELQQVSDFFALGREDIEALSFQPRFTSERCYDESSTDIHIYMKFVRRTGRDRYENDQVSFLLRGNLLVSYRNYDYDIFEETYRTLDSTLPEDGDDIFMLLMDNHIEEDANFIEDIGKEMTRLSAHLVSDSRFKDDTLLVLSHLQHLTLTIRENLSEKERLLLTVLKSRFFPKDDAHRVEVMAQEAAALLAHLNFNFERLEFLQNTFLGLVGVDQNRVIKIFTVVTVIFMPPTLIASLYGMNFAFMPELNKVWGYPVALLVMVLSSVLTLLFFKHKKWF